jgi:hypothetical protein
MEGDGSDDRLRQIFDACDDDDDGFISLDQFRSALLSSELGDPHSLLGDLEETKEGMVSFAAFQKAVLELQSQLEATADLGNGDQEINLDELSGEECVDEDESECQSNRVTVEGDRNGRERSVASSKDEGFINDDASEMVRDFEGIGEGDDSDTFDVNVKDLSPSRASVSQRRISAARALQSSQQSSGQSSVEDIAEVVNSLDATDLELEQAEEINKMSKQVRFYV